jgi:hypothetical protein
MISGGNATVVRTWTSVLTDTLGLAPAASESLGHARVCTGYWSGRAQG